MFNVLGWPVGAGHGVFAHMMKYNELNKHTPPTPPPHGQQVIDRSFIPVVPLQGHVYSIVLSPMGAVAA
jgi:hypothetical protein